MFLIRTSPVKIDLEGVTITVGSDQLFAMKFASLCALFGYLLHFRNDLTRDLFKPDSAKFHFLSSLMLAFLLCMVIPSVVMAYRRLRSNILKQQSLPTTTQVEQHNADRVIFEKLGLKLSLSSFLNFVNKFNIAIYLCALSFQAVTGASVVLYCFMNLIMSYHVYTYDGTEVHNKFQNHSLFRHLQLESLQLFLIAAALIAKQI